MRNKYTVGYFIRKFKAIPGNQWCCGQFVNARGQKCVLGHLGARGVRLASGFQLPEPAQALVKLVKDGGITYDIADINNHSFGGFTQKTPRARVLAVLRYLKRKLAR